MDMRKHISIKVLAVVFCLSMLTASTVLAAGTPKIGYFDPVAVLQMSQWGKQASEEYKKQAERIDADLQQKEKAFAGARDEYDKKKDVLDQKAKSKKEQDLKDMQQEGQKMLAESRGKLTDFQSVLAKKIREVVEKVAKEEKYDFVFERTALVYANEKEDITKRVAAELDKLPPFRY
jgi:outer membrane protein